MTCGGSDLKSNLNSAAWPTVLNHKINSVGMYEPTQPGKDIELVLDSTGSRLSPVKTLHQLHLCCCSLVVWPAMFNWQVDSKYYIKCSEYEFFLNPLKMPKLR